jgi:hypothetical protein
MASVFLSVSPPMLPAMVYKLQMPVFTPCHLHRESYGVSLQCYTCLHFSTALLLPPRLLPLLLLTVAFGLPPFARSVELVSEGKHVTVFRIPQSPSKHHPLMRRLLRRLCMSQTLPLLVRYFADQMSLTSRHFSTVELIRYVTSLPDTEECVCMLWS